MENKKIVPFLVFGAIALLVILVLSNSVFLTIKPGERGVIFRKFSTGLDKENIYPPGFEIVAPWNSMYVYDVKEQTSEEKMDVLDRNGLSISVDITVRFHPLYEKIGYLHEKFGEGYVNRLVIPEVRSAVRKVMGRFSAEEIYSTKRKEVEDQITTETALLLSSEDNNIKMTALLIRSIILPDKITQAIENKLQAEQQALAMQFVKQKETEEAERKRIAASGEARANEIINNSLTDELLKMRGIEATTELSKSPNAKVIVIGSGSDGLPLILGNN